MTLAAQRSFEDLGASLHDVRFCVLDLETTGGSPTGCEITEIGAVRFRGGEPDGTFQTLVNPGGPIPAFITVLTGITQAMVVEAPRLDEAMAAFLEFLGDAVIVGHNTRFDLSFLNAAARRLGYGPLTNPSTDTVALARRLCRTEVRNLKLATLAAHFRSPVTPNHRALEDARATAHVFFSLLERCGNLGVTHLEDLLRLSTARGGAHYRKIRLTESLPRRPGVYLFRDRDGRVIYVGKAGDLRSRVRSYFYGDERRSVADMLRELDAVDHRVCVSDIEAQVTELRLIAAHTPRYNRRSKPGAVSWVKLTTERFPRLSIARSVRDDGALYLGPFRGKRGADPIVAALWDAVPIRRCSGRPGTRSARCAFAQLGVAMCPCDGSVDSADYAGVIEVLREGVEQRPDLLLEPLRDRMVAHATAGRYEEAAWIRDRHQALARALEYRRAWIAFQRAGMVRAETVGGEGVLVEAGRLAAAWGPGDPPPLIPIPDGDAPAAPVPPTSLAAEESRLLWTWLTGPDVRLVDVSGTLALPAHPVRHLPVPR